jgi:hypothetical protein
LKLARVAVVVHVVVHHHVAVVSRCRLEVRVVECAAVIVVVVEDVVRIVEVVRVVVVLYRCVIEDAAIRLQNESRSIKPNATTTATRIVSKNEQTNLHDSLRRVERRRRAHLRVALRCDRHQLRYTIVVRCFVSSIVDVES